MAGQRILCIEDDRIILQMTSELLRSEGYDVTEWPEGDGAYGVIARELPMLILLDVRMERRDSGLQLLRMVRGNPRTHAIPVILYSANVPFFEENAAEIAALGCDTLEKPFLIDDLLARVRRHIGAPNAVRSMAAVIPPLSAEQS